MQTGSADQNPPDQCAPGPDRAGTGGPGHGVLHHVEVWVPDLRRADAEWGWLLEQLGYTAFQQWPAGRSWQLGSSYLVFEESAALSARTHDRLRPGLNHLAFHVADEASVDSLVGQAVRHGWTPLFPDRYPHAGGEQCYAGYLENTDGFEVELVAIPRTAPAGPSPGPGS